MTAARESHAAGAGRSGQIAVALSGGGHRACVFALGALLYLADAGLGRRVASIASVSGGSLANSAIGSRLDFTTSNAGMVEDVVRTVAGRIASLPLALRGGWKRAYLILVVACAGAVLVGWWWLPVSLPLRFGALVFGVALLAVLVWLGLTGGGTLFGWWGTWTYLSALVLLPELGVVAVTQWFDWSVAAEIAAATAGLIVIAWVVSQRGRVSGRAFGHTLFENGSSTHLSDLSSSLDHVICATDLQGGHHVYFSQAFVCGYGFGLGEPGSLPLHVPTQASAAFPGAFPLRSLRASRLHFRLSHDAGEPDLSGAGTLKLVDGGVYDNMADQWAQGLPQRAKRLGKLGASFRPVDEAVVVSASAGLRPKALRRMWLPLLGELFTLLRDKDVLYDNGNSVRRRELVARFDLAELHPPGLKGALVHIEQSPFTVPRALEHDTGLWPERAQRAKNALASLEASAKPGHDVEASWTEVAEANAAVPTTLVSFTSGVTARLLHHAYVLAMVNLHVILGYPLLEVPAQERFDELLR